MRNNGGRKRYKLNTTTHTRDCKRKSKEKRTPRRFKGNQEEATA